MQRDHYKKLLGKWDAIFEKDLSEFFGNYFTNPFKPTKIEHECFELETGMKWSIKPEEDEIK